MFNLIQHLYTDILNLIRRCCYISCYVTTSQNWGIDYWSQIEHKQFLLLNPCWEKLPTLKIFSALIRASLHLTLSTHESNYIRCRLWELHFDLRWPPSVSIALVLSSKIQCNYSFYEIVLIVIMKLNTINWLFYEFL